MQTRLQTLSTNGKGGVTGNNRGVRQYQDQLFAAVNYGSGTVAVFQRAGDQLTFEQTVVTTSPPVSLEFANGHMYVAGDTTVDSFILQGSHIGGLDGTARLVLAGGGVPIGGDTAQVAAAGGNTLLVSIKTDPIPGTMDVVPLNSNGAVSGMPVGVSAPPGTLTPFGFSVYPDGSAVVTLAHSNQFGLFRNNSFIDVVAAGQMADCWTTRVGKYVFAVNTGSHTISRVLGTGSNIFVDSAVATTITTGAPTDADSTGGYFGVIDHTTGAGAASHLTLFTYDELGELSPIGSALNLGVPAPDGIAIMAPEFAAANSITGNLTVSAGQVVNLSQQTVTGNVTVTGGTLILRNGSRIGGNLQVSGGSVSLAKSAIGGNAQFDGGGSFSIGEGVAINGNLQIGNLPASAGLNTVCGSSVGGNLEFHNNNAPAAIGSGSGCAGNLVGGNLQVNNNFAQVQVFGNQVTNNLQCQQNSSITGGGNAARSKQGQCSAF
jgi:hypothetical protein